MKIAIDISPIKGRASIQHRFRGTGFYTKNLIDTLQRYDKKNIYTFFERGDKLPKDVDLIHYPYFEPFFLTLPFIQKIPYIVTVHDLTPLVFPKYFPIGIKGRIKWEAQKRSLKRAKGVITDSNSSKNDIIKFASISPKKIDVVYLAASRKFQKKNISDREKEDLKYKYKLPSKFALYVGDATWNKNLPRLIKASISANIPLVLTGKALLDPDYDNLNPWNKDLSLVQELSKNNKNIIKIGFVEDKDLVYLYNIAVIFVMPSAYEGFGLPILEAMACGCPTITSDEGSIPEVAGDAAYYVNANDVKSIENGMKEMFHDELLRSRFRDKGFIQAKKFTWRKTTEQTEAVYRKI